MSNSHGFWICDRILTKTGEKGVFHPLRKYHLQSQYETEQFLKRRRKSSRNDTEDTTATASDDDRPKPPLAKLHPWHSGAWLFEVPLYAVPLFVWDRLAPRRAAKIALLPPPTAFGVFRDVLSGLLLYDFLFFFAHYAFHKIPPLYRAFHKKHHASREVRACDQVRLSGVEEIVDVGISIVALRVLKAHALSRTVYNLVITFLLTELHSGYAFPWSPQDVVPFGLSTGSRGHHHHHRHGTKYYQKFFCTLDRLFGFVDEEATRRRTTPVAGRR